MRVVAAAVVLVALVRAAPAAPTVLDLRVRRDDGTVATLRDVVGDRPTLIAFWATYCVPCRVEVPALNRAAERWRERGLRVVGVAFDTDAARVRDTRRSWDMRYDVLTVAPGEPDTTDTLFPRSLPASAFVARGAALLHEGLLDDVTLERLVPALLEGPAPK